MRIKLRQKRKREITRSRRRGSAAVTAWRSIARRARRSAGPNGNGQLHSQCLTMAHSSTLVCNIVHLISRCRIFATIQCQNSKSCMEHLAARRQARRGPRPSERTAISVSRDVTRPRPSGASARTAKRSQHLSQSQPSLSTSPLTAFLFTGDDNEGGSTTFPPSFACLKSSHPPTFPGPGDASSTSLRAK